MADDLDRVIGETGIGRRAFLRGLVKGTAFAAPIVSSFAMGGIAAASAHDRERHPISNPNQTQPISNPNQTHPEHHHGQTHPEHHHGQTHPEHHHGRSDGPVGRHHRSR